MRRTRIGALAAIALIATSCELLEEELPTAAFVSWPELEWEPVPHEHEPYMPALIETIEVAMELERSTMAADGAFGAHLRDLPEGFPIEGVTIYSGFGGGFGEFSYVEFTAFHVEAPGSGCIARLGARRLERFEDVEGLVEARYNSGMRLPDAPGVIECMRRRPEDELRPRITRHEL